MGNSCKSGAGKGGPVSKFDVTVDTRPPVVIASPAFESWAVKMRTLLKSEEGSPVCWETFKSGDPNTRFDFQLCMNRRVVVLFDTVDQTRLFEQLSLVQALQGFAVPDPEDVGTKWKHYAEAGKYSWGRASEIIVVIPWYRPCQMERTSRWGRDGDKWTNSDPEGGWLDVPHACTLARLMATPGPPPPGAGPTKALDGHPLKPLWWPTKRLVFVELHEETPVREAVRGFDAVIQTERFVPYFLQQIRERPSYSGKESTFVLFPDFGAFGRYSEAVFTELGLPREQVMWIKKSRVGNEIEQVQKLFYDKGQGESDPGEKTSFLETDHVIIIDDFTNSGSTLFGAVKLCRSKAGSAVESMAVSIFVSHLVAAYDPEVVKTIKKKIEDLGPKCKFYTTDSVPSTTDLLRDDSPQEEEKRWQDQKKERENRQVEVFAIADFLAHRLGMGVGMTDPGAGVRASQLGTK